MNIKKQGNSCISILLTTFSVHSLTIKLNIFGGDVMGVIPANIFTRRPRCVVALH